MRLNLLITRSHPLARSLRYPRPIKESRGDSLRNRVAIVRVRSAHLNAKTMKQPFKYDLYRVRFMREAHSNFVKWKAHPIFAAKRQSTIKREESIAVIRSFFNLQKGKVYIFFHKISFFLKECTLFVKNML